MGRTHAVEYAEGLPHQGTGVKRRSGVGTEAGAICDKP